MLVCAAQLLFFFLMLAQCSFGSFTAGSQGTHNVKCNTD
jgi:hypothetical protein